MEELTGLQKLQALVEDTYLLADKNIVKVVCMTVVANRLPLKPVWIFIVAPSGGAKSEFITSINEVAGVHPLSLVTARTFISGQVKGDGAETSLLFKISGGIVTFKDFTTMLSSNEEERKAIFGQLREIYDGSMDKSFGTGKDVKWKGKVGLLAGVTYKIHSVREMYADMGERFIIYAMQQPERIEAGRRALRNSRTSIDRHSVIRAAFKNFLDKELYIPKELSEVPTIDAQTEQELLELAEFATRARSTIERDWHSSGKEIKEVYPPEMPTRFAEQLVNCATALMVINKGPLTKDDKTILYKMALDSVTVSRRRTMQEMSKYAVIETNALAIKLDFPTNTVRRWLEDLTALEILSRVKDGRQDMWKINDKYRDIIAKFDDIKYVGGELLEDFSNPEGFAATPDKPVEPITEEKIKQLAEEEGKQERLI